jgi:hypothetical protein
MPVEQKLTVAQQTALELLRQELVSQKVYRDTDTLGSDDNTIL